MNTLQANTSTKDEDGEKIADLKKKVQTCGVAAYATAKRTASWYEAKQPLHMPQPYP